MKKYLMLLLVATGLTATTFAQKEKEEKEEKDEKKEKVTVPSTVKQAFAKQFPGAKASWSKESTGVYEAGFKQAGNEMSAVFDEQGALMETEIEIRTTELPAAVLTYVKANYKNAPIKEAARITKANGEVTYEANVNKTDVLFDAGGKFIREVKG